MSTLYWIITLFALGALVGLYLLALVLQKKETPLFVALIHGAFVVCAFILLIYYASERETGLTESIILFFLAAIGGLTLFIRDVLGKSLPDWLAIGHGMVAIVGFIFLLLNTFG